MRLCNVAHVDVHRSVHRNPIRQTWPSRWRQWEDNVPVLRERVIAQPARDDVLVPVPHRLAQVHRLVDVVDVRPEHVRRVQHRQVEPERRLALLPPLPGRTLRKRLARAILANRGRVSALLLNLRDRLLVPRGLVQHDRFGRDTEERSGGREDDDPLDPRAVRLCGLQHGERAGDGRTDDLFRLDRVHVEGRGRVRDRVDILDMFCERIILEAEPEVS